MPKMKKNNSMQLIKFFGFVLVIMVLGLSGGISAVNEAKAEVLFEEDFDNQTDWFSQQGIIGDDHVWPTTWAIEDGGGCSTYCPASGWTTYRGVASYWNPARNDTYAINSIGARGDSGKGFVYWHEASGGWADGAGLEKFLSYDGYNELYLRYYEK
jgi:hypothetical protein